MTRTYVTRAAQPASAEFAGQDLEASLDYVASRSAPGMPRLAIWRTSPPPDEGPDAVVCVPLAVLMDCQARAAEVVRQWDERWLLIESMPRLRRDEARDGLRAAVVASLLDAVSKGIADAANWDTDDEDELIF